MHPRQFVMISKTYSDGVSLQKDGPRTTKTFSSESTLVDDRTYRTAAYFVPKWAAKHFVTTLTVGEELTFFESVSFERRTVMRSYSETTHVFMPRDIVHSYCSSLLYEPDATERLYRAGVELLPAQKCFAVEEKSQCEIDIANGSCSKRAINGDINGNLQIVNGNVQLSERN